jgi:hypothetical protein
MEIQDYIYMGHDFIVVPKAVKDVPIVMSKMVKEDGTYHSIATLEETLGTLFQSTHIIDDRFILIHYGFSRNGEEALFHSFMQGAGLVNMRGELESVEAIDFTNLNGNEYGIFSEWEVQSVPNIVAE